MRPYDLALFDLDGVLIDSRANMAAAWRAVQSECGVDVPFERYFAQIGLPFADILRRLGLGEGPSEVLGQAEVVYARASIEHFELVECYRGIVKALAALRRGGLALGIVTSKDAGRTALAIERIGAHFDVVQSPAPGLRGKPAPDQLLAAAAALGVAPPWAIYVGDMPVDALSARHAGMAYAHADWGYGQPLANTRLRFASPADVPDLLLSARQRVSAAS